jgi:hypothetical protein
MLYQLFYKIKFVFNSLRRVLFETDRDQGLNPATGTSPLKLEIEEILQ